MNFANIDKEYYALISDRLSRLDYTKVYNINKIISAAKSQKETFTKGKWVKGKERVDNWLINNIFPPPYKDPIIFKKKYVDKLGNVADNAKLRTDRDYGPGHYYIPQLKKYLHEAKIYHQRYTTYIICCFLNNGGKIRIRKHLLYDNINKLSNATGKEIIESDIIKCKVPEFDWPLWRQNMWHIRGDNITIQYKNAQPYYRKQLVAFISVMYLRPQMSLPVELIFLIFKNIFVGNKN